MRFGLMCLCGFTAPLGEGVFQVAAALLLLALGFERFLGPKEDQSERVVMNPELRLVVIVWGLWCAWGIASAFIQGREPRFSYMNHLTMAWAAVLGFWLPAKVSMREAQRLCVWFLGGLLLSGVVGIYQYWVGAFPGEEILRGGRGYMGQLYIPGTANSTAERAAAGLYLNRLKLAEAMILGVSVTSALAFYAESRWIRRLSLGVMGVSLVALWASFSKAAWLAVPAAAGFWFALRMARERVRLVWWGLFGVVVASTLVAVFAGLSLESWEALPGLDSWNIRRWIWKHAMAMWADHPWLGCGMGTYHQAVVPYFPVELYRLSHSINAHHQHLAAFVEGGVVGGLLWFGFLLAIGRVLERIWRLQLDRSEAGLRLMATSLVSGMVCFSLVHVVFYHPSVSICVWIALGLSGRLYATHWLESVDKA